jgi:hypothetical protein
MYYAESMQGRLLVLSYETCPPSITLLFGKGFLLTCAILLAITFTQPGVTGLPDLAMNVT